MSAIPGFLQTRNAGAFRLDYGTRLLLCVSVILGGDSFSLASGRHPLYVSVLWALSAAVPTVVALGLVGYRHNGRITTPSGR
jgi:hypothetical protein